MIMLKHYIMKERIARYEIQHYWPYIPSVLTYSDALSRSGGAHLGGQLLPSLDDKQGSILCWRSFKGNSGATSFQRSKDPGLVRGGARSVHRVHLKWGPESSTQR